MRLIELFLEKLHDLMTRSACVNALTRATVSVTAGGKCFALQGVVGIKRAFFTLEQICTGTATHWFAFLASVSYKEIFRKSLLITTWQCLNVVDNMTTFVVLIRPKTCWVTTIVWSTIEKIVPVFTLTDVTFESHADSFERSNSRG